MISGKKLVVILCMHRSGSSMVTNVLQRLGMSLGPFELVGATEHNKYGHFEAIPIHGLDRELQQHLFGFNEDIPPSPALFSQFCGSQAAWRLEARDLPPEFFDRGFNLIQQLTDSGHISGFKDPRVPLLWPFWEKILRSFSGIQVIPLVILRSPHEVAMSIFSRSQGAFTYQAALDVAAVHFQRLLEIQRSWRGERIVVRYVNGLFEKDLQRAVERLELVWDEGIFRQVYDADCKHHEPAIVSHPAQNWFDRLIRLGNAKPAGRSGSGKLDPAQLKRLEADAARREEILRTKAGRALSQIELHVQEQKRLSETLQQAQAECQQEKTQHAQAAAAIQDYQQQISRLELAVNQYQAAAQEQQAQSSAGQEQAAQLQRQNAQLTEEIQALSHCRDEMALALHQAREECSGHQARHDLVQETLSRARAAAEERQARIRRLRTQLRRKTIRLAVRKNEAALLTTQRDELTNAFLEKEVDLRRAQDALALAQTESRRLQNVIVERKEDADQAAGRHRSELAARQSETERLQTELAEAAGRHLSELTALHSETERLQGELAERDKKHRWLSGQSDHWEQYVGQIRRSKSWRITKPLRALADASRQIRRRCKMPGMRAVLRVVGLHWLRERIRLRLRIRRIAPKLADTGLFDGDWYRKEYPDVAESKLAPERHYLIYGRHEGRRPTPWFDAAWYQSAFADVAASGMDPFLHYCFHGSGEGRAPNPSVQQTFGPVVPSGAVEFAAAETPLVSIVVPVHNQWYYTLWCLRSIQRNSDGVSYEVIVADDASTDETCHISRHVKNATVIRQEKESLGFLRNCNSAALRARGKYLLFLNNDTLVQPDWLRWMVDVAENDEKVGVVGAKLVYPDGRLQEAGGIIWNDASGVNYGRLDTASKPEYNYVRDPNYVSGAALLVRRAFWDDVGGFDPRYEPAYYEDTDLAFQARQRGWRVVYQPKAVVVHFEGVSHGTDLTKGVKRYQVINQRRFVEKWHTTLQEDHFPPRQDLFLARQRNRKHILVVDVGVPRPDCDSGSVREANFLKILIQLGYQITFYPDNQAQLEPYLTQLQQQGITVLCGPNTPSLEQFLRENGRYFQVAVVSRVDVAGRHFETVRKHCPQATIIYDTVDLHFLREQRRAEVEHDPALRAAAERNKKQELALIRGADVALVVSDFEAQLLKREAPEANVRIVSNIHEVYGCGQPFARRRDLLFIGLFAHLPNADAMLWFLKDVFPLVRCRLPGIQMHLIGLDPPAELRAMAAPDVHILGQVKDIGPYFNDCRISVAPLRYGAGVKGKINLSMSYGLPVVATSVGCEGMHLTDGVDVLTADDAQSFADAICRLYNDQPLWEQLSQAGLENIQRHFSLEKARQTVSEILEHGRLDSRAVETESPATIPFPAAVAHEACRQVRIAEKRSSDLAGDGTADVPRSDGAARRLIAFYLPQYHPIPENDRWWGKGFTEWTNVAKARPLFEGHYQPHLPTELGYYDLRLPDARQAQADLARQYGIHAFCYYHYWFGGQRLLERPFNEVLAAGQPDFPFCLCWANENWSRRWDGGDGEIVMRQEYSSADDRRHIEWLLEAFADPRYLRIDGRPVMLIYRARHLPNVRQTSDVWREAAARRGFKDLYLCRVESFDDEHDDPAPHGFDAAVEFQPDWLHLGPPLDSSVRNKLVIPEGLRVYDYDCLMKRMLAKPPIAYKRFPCVVPSWDNTARQGSQGLVIANSAPEHYQRWLAEVLRRRPVGRGDENLVFVNAWNEWAEGNHLEPDARFGRGYLEATRRAIEAADAPETIVIRVHRTEAA